MNAKLLRELESVGVEIGAPMSYAEELRQTFEEAAKVNSLLSALIGSIGGQDCADQHKEVEPDCSLKLALDTYPARIRAAASIAKDQIRQVRDLLRLS